MAEARIPSDVTRLAELRELIKQKMADLRLLRAEAKGCEERIDQFLTTAQRDGVQVNSQVAIRETVKSTKRGAPSEEEQAAICLKYGIQVDETSRALLRDLQACAKPQAKTKSRIRVEPCPPCVPSAASAASAP